MEIQDLPISTRAKEAFRKVRIDEVEQLINFTYYQLYWIDGIGKTTLDDIAQEIRPFKYKDKYKDGDPLFDFCRAYCGEIHIKKPVKACRMYWKLRSCAITSVTELYTIQHFLKSDVNPALVKQIKNFKIYDTLRKLPKTYGNR